MKPGFYYITLDDEVFAGPFYSDTEAWAWVTKQPFYSREHYSWGCVYVEQYVPMQ